MVGVNTLKKTAISLMEKKMPSVPIVVKMVITRKNVNMPGNLLWLAMLITIAQLSLNLKNQKSKLKITKSKRIHWRPNKWMVRKNMYI